MIMQVQKRHLPIVGLLGLVVVAAAGGGIYYYQFVASHVTATFLPSHRLIFMTAIVQEEGGFHITNTAYLNQTGMPGFDSSNGYNLTGVKYQNYQTQSDNRTIQAHVGDTLTFYIKGENATSSDPQLHLSQSHGFTIQGTGFTVNNGILPGTIPFGKWYTVTIVFTAAGSFIYFCSVPCSPLHGNMNGQIVVT